MTTDTNRLHILVCGADGQVGRVLRTMAPNYPFKFSYCDYQEIDLSAPLEVVEPYIRRVFAESNCAKLILNLAAYTLVDKAEEEQETAMRINAGVVATLGRIVEGIDDCGLMHLSTDYVFDGERNHPYTEDDLPRPLSVYGSSKAEGERLLLPLGAAGRAMVVRTAWIYAVGANNFVSTMLRLSGERDCVRVVADQIGSPTYAPHLIEALLKIITIYTKEGVFRTPLLHITNSGVASWYDLAAYAIHKSGSKTPVLPIGTSDYHTAARRPYYSILSKQRLADTYGIVLPHWVEGVNAYVEAQQEVDQTAHKPYK